jgi:hypothetical protein
LVAELKSKAQIQINERTLQAIAYKPVRAEPRVAEP